MAKTKSTKRAADDKALLTLTEVSQQTGISMPTLQRYKKLFQERIPSVGSGRSQRYEPEALDVFRQLKEENIKKRGRPRKSDAAAQSASKPRKKTRAKKVTTKTPKTASNAAPTTAAEASPKAPAKASRKAAPKGKGKKPANPKKRAAPGGGLLTLTEIGVRTGISYPTLLRYVKNHIDDIPHVGEGRGRRYKAAAVRVFERLRAKSPRGRAAATKRSASSAVAPAKRVIASGDAGLSARVKSLEASHARLIKTIERLEKAVKQPVRLVVKG